VESVPDRRSGAWVFQEYTNAGSYRLRAVIEEIVEQFHVTREQIRAVLEFAARSLEAPPVPVGASASTDAHSLLTMGPRPA
jgi:hypothetical protein